MNTARIYKEDFGNSNIWKLMLIELELPPETDEITVKAVAYNSDSTRTKPRKKDENGNNNQN